MPEIEEFSSGGRNNVNVNDDNHTISKALCILSLKSNEVWPAGVRVLFEYGSCVDDRNNNNVMLDSRWKPIVSRAFCYFTRVFSIFLAYDQV